MNKLGQQHCSRQALLVQEFWARLRDICDHINTHFDVEGLCEGLPDRVQEVIDSEGDRIKCRLSENGMHLKK